MDSEITTTTELINDNNILIEEENQRYRIFPITKDISVHDYYAALKQYMYQRKVYTKRNRSNPLRQFLPQQQLEITKDIEHDNNTDPEIDGDECGSGWKLYFHNSLNTNFTKDSAYLRKEIFLAIKNMAKPLMGLVIDETLIDKAKPHRAKGIGLLHDDEGNVVAGVTDILSLIDHLMDGSTFQEWPVIDELLRFSTGNDHHQQKFSTKTSSLESYIHSEVDRYPLLVKLPTLACSLFFCLERDWTQYRITLYDYCPETWYGTSTTVIDDDSKKDEYIPNIQNHKTYTCCSICRKYSIYVWSQCESCHSIYCGIDCLRNVSDTSLHINCRECLTRSVLIQHVTR